MRTHLRQAYRSLRRSPGASLISLAVLALGIGAATALFSLYNSLVLRPLPVLGGSRMAALRLDYGKSVLPRGLCLEERQALGPLGGPVEALVLEEFQVVRVQAGDLRASLKAVLTSPDYFATLGVRPRLGAAYRAQEPGVVISSALWRTAFGAPPSLEGLGLRINGAWLPVVGIAPPGFQGLKPAQAPDLWLPADAIRLWNTVEQQAFTERGAGTLHAFVGIFGLQSQLTAQRTREAGLRIALGASPASVALTFTRAVLVPALAGLAGGLVLVRVGRGLLEHLLGGLGGVTWPSLLASATVLLAAALTAAWIPALSAARRDPASTLRAE